MSEPGMILTGYEALSRPFRYVVDFYPDEPPDLADLVGNPHTVRLPLPDGTTRPLNGVVFRAEQGPSTVRSARHRLELRPWFRLLDQDRTCAVFQNMSVPEIVTQVCNDAGFGNIRNALASTYPVREYTVRYGETSFAFLSRLMAEAGIFYFFEHDAAAHTLVMADSPDAFADCAQGATLEWLATASDDDGPAAPSAHVRSLSLARQAVPASCLVDDYNEATPETDLSASAGNGFPCLGYPLAGYREQQAGETLAGARLDACEAKGFFLRATSSCSGLTAGGLFTVKGHPDGPANARWAVSELRFTAVFPGNGAAEDGTFLASLTALPAAARFRPLPSLARPRVGGPLTGVVTGKDDEEVWTDGYGRCKLRFHWQGESDETSSCWVRVAQPWTGNGYGALFLPRVGQEVVVSFLGGDPDRPLVTGMVYNSGNPPPWPLPENSACSGLLTRSMPDGQAGNELRFKDKKDEEEVYVHAQKALVYEVEDARTVTILGEGGDALTLEKSDRTVLLKEGKDALTLDKGSRTALLKEGDDALTLEKGRRTVALKEGDDALTLEKGNRTVSLENGDETLSVQGKRRIETKGDEERRHGANVVINVKGDYTLKVSGNVTIEAGGSLTLKSTGKTSLTAQGGMAIASSVGLDLSAKAQLSQKAPKIGIKADAMGEVDGGALLVVKGGLVKIN